MHPLWHWRACVHLQDGHLTDSLSTLWGHWQSDVKWPQHYLNLSRQFWVSSINPHPSSAEKHHLQCLRKGAHQHGKKLPSVTEDWVWAKIRVLTQKCLPVDSGENEIVAYILQLRNMMKDLRGQQCRSPCCGRSVQICQRLFCTQSNALSKTGTVGSCHCFTLYFFIN